MRRIYILVLFVISHFAGCSQITNVKLKDSVIFSIIEFYADSIKIPEGQYGVFLVELRVDDSLLKPIELTANYERFDIKNYLETKASYSLRICFTSTVNGLKLNPPDFYIIHKNKPVMLYSGMNFLVTRSRKEIQDLLKSLEKYLSKNKTYNFEPGSMEFLVNGSKFTLVK
jgi:hypothetical protein